MSASTRPHGARSCDRCFSLKTQCDLAEVCGRCRRLGLECTNVRPIRPKGRPRKLENPNHPQAPDTGSPLFADLISCSLDQVSTQHLTPAVASTLLEHMASLTHGHGFYAALLSIPSLTGPFRDSRTLASPETALTPTLVCSLLAVALDLFQQSHLVVDHQSAKLNGESLRASSLAQIPHILSRYTWCFTREHMDVSVRWATLARVIITDAIKAPKSRPPALRDLEQRVCLGLGLHECVLGLLHYGHVVSISQKGFPGCPVALSGSLQGSEPGSALTGSRGGSYFELFTPLIRITTLILQEPHPGSRAWRTAYDSLEEFYILFPTNLLMLDNVEFLYQAESMIWMHGLLMILYVGRDLSTIMLRPNVLNDETLRHVLGHSLLLGEILATVERLGGGFEFLSPALVFFLLISCAVHIATLGRYLPDPTDAVGITNAGPDVHWASEPPIPEKLVESSWAHLQILSAIRTQCDRYDSPLILDMQRLLESCYKHLVLGDAKTEAIPATTLMLYRWSGSGTGIIPLESWTAFAEWMFPLPPGADILECLASHSENSRAIIDEVCSPDSRICESGCFDLSIVIA